MSPKTNPNGTCSYNQGMIESQCRDCNTATGRFTNNFCPIFTPGKMIMPVLATWVK